MPATQKIKQTGKGLNITHLLNGQPDPCANCNDWTGCQGCQLKTKDIKAQVGSDTAQSILDGIDWDSI